MALSVNTALPAIAGTGNPIPCKVQSNNYIATPALTATIERTVGIAATVGQTWIFTLTNGVVVTLTAATTPDGSGTQFTAGTTTRATLVADLNKSYYLNLYYNITVSGTLIRFEARNFGAAYNMTISGTWTGNTASGTNTAGADAVLRTNFAVIADLWIEQAPNTGNYGAAPIAQLAQTVDNFGYSVFDFSAILESYVRSPLPSYTNTNVTNALAAIRRYRVNVAEIYDIPVKIVHLLDISTSPKLAFNARKKHEHVAGNNNTFTAPFFLSDRPLSKRVTTDQREYIAMLWDTVTCGALNAAMKVYFSDGTSSADVILTMPSLTGVGIVYFPAGYTQRGVAAVTPAKTPVRYTISIFSVTENDYIFEFIVEEKCPTFMRYYLLKNELGGWDTLRAGGIRTHSLLTEREQATRTLPVNYVNTFPETFTHQVTGQDEFDTSTGYIFDSRDEAEYYAAQLILSEAVYIDAATHWRPIIVLTDSVRIARDRQNMLSVSWKYRNHFRIGDKRSNADYSE
jgi:hypothetical protein